MARNVRVDVQVGSPARVLGMTSDGEIVDCTLEGLPPARLVTLAARPDPAQDGTPCDDHTQAGSERESDPLVRADVVEQHDGQRADQQSRNSTLSGGPRIAGVGHPLWDRWAQREFPQLD